MVKKFCFVFTNHGLHLYLYRMVGGIYKIYE